MPTYYMDYENGSDAAAGTSWATAWQTLTAGPTAARIAPGDVVRIAKSGAPASIGNATWTDLSGTVTLATGTLTSTIDLCETAWTAATGADCTVTRTAVATDAKEGDYCMKLAMDASVQTGIVQAFYSPGSIDLSAYQKISFWLKSDGTIPTNGYTITLCSDTNGSVPVDTFAIPWSPHTGRWMPVTLARNGGGNLGSAIQSIALNTGAAAPPASKYLYVDDFIACTTDGLNLQSLISKNSAESGGPETWYGIKSINGTTVRLDLDTNSKAFAALTCYSGATETVTTYKRETIKTTLASLSFTQVQAIQDSGSAEGGNIEFQGGYNTSSDTQDGETIFDGMNGQGYGIYASAKSFLTLNRLSVVRYNAGMYYSSSNNNTITTLTAANNNSNYGVYYSSSNNNTITTLTAANNNSNYGVYFISAENNTITTATAINNNTTACVYYNGGSNNFIGNLTTTGNGATFWAASGWNYIGTATCAESTKVTITAAYSDCKVFITSLSGSAYIGCDYGNIVSQTASAGGSGIEWKMSVTNTARGSLYPLKMSIGKVAVGSSGAVTVTVYGKKSHATDIAGAISVAGGQFGGPASGTIFTFPNNTDRNQGTITWTPSAAGVVEIEAWAYWLANTADENVIFDDIAITQA